MMPLSLADRQTLSDLSNLLYNFLPGSGNNTTSFPIAAQRAGIAECWKLDGSKGPAISRLLSVAYEARRPRFSPLIQQVVELGIAYRARKSDPLTREEIDRLNELLLQLEIKVPELHDPNFLGRLPRMKGSASASAAGSTPAAPPKPDPKIARELRDYFLRISNLAPHPRGIEFEKFLNRLFEAHGLVPREAFRNRGEQIDGSFIHRHETFLLEARWQAKEVAAQALWSFAAKVETKSTWSRGLFISESGFTEDGLFAFRQGKPTPLVCMDGYDLYLLLEHGLSLEDVLDRKKRKAAETGAAFVPVRTLYANL
jgi:restriction endonuclease